VSLTFGSVGSSQQNELLGLWAMSWAEVYPDIDFEARLPWFTGHLAEWSARGAACVAAFKGIGGPMAGFILLDAATGHLDQICVRLDQKGAGVATALLAEARRLSAPGLTLDVNALNLRAIRFYEREGFVKTGEGVNPHSGLPIFHYRWRP
jgi:putative acetyltransferase